MAAYGLTGAELDEWVKSLCDAVSEHCQARIRHGLEVYTSETFRSCINRRKAAILEENFPKERFSAALRASAANKIDKYFNEEYFSYIASLHTAKGGKRRRRTMHRKRSHKKNSSRRNRRVRQ